VNFKNAVNSFNYLKNIASWLRFFIRLARRSIATLISFVIILIYVLLSILVVVGIVPQLPPAKTGWENIYNPPSFREFPWYILGTDFSGRPLLLAIVRGMPITLTIAFLAAIITVSVGTIIGLISGYFGGTIDTILSFITNVALTIPTYLLALIFVVILPPELKNNVLILASILSITAWASLARAIRAQTLSLKRREFIDVARVIGFSPFKIMFDHILRLMAPFIAINLILAMVSAIYGYTGLAFLGLMPMASENWGVQIYLAIRAGGALYSDKAILALWSPIITIVLLQYSLINIAKVVEELFNPAVMEEIFGGE